LHSCDVPVDFWSLGSSVLHLVTLIDEANPAESRKWFSNKTLKSTPGWIRTSDRRIRNPVLYPTELRARIVVF
jgi:hypothetical protein